MLDLQCKLHTCYRQFISDMEVPENVMLVGNAKTLCGYWSWVQRFKNTARVFLVGIILYTYVCTYACMYLSLTYNINTQLYTLPFYYCKYM